MAGIRRKGINLAILCLLQVCHHTGLTTLDTNHREDFMRAGLRFFGYSLEVDWFEQ